MEATDIAYGQDINAVRFMNEAQTAYLVFIPSAAVGRYWVIEEGQGLEPKMREVHENELADVYHPKVAKKVKEETQGWNMN